MRINIQMLPLERKIVIFTFIFAVIALISGMTVFLKALFFSELLITYLLLISLVSMILIFFSKRIALHYQKWEEPD